MPMDLVGQEASAAGEPQAVNSMDSIWGTWYKSPNFSGNARCQQAGRSPEHRQSDVSSVTSIFCLM